MATLSRAGLGLALCIVAALHCQQALACQSPHPSPKASTQRSLSRKVAAPRSPSPVTLRASTTPAPDVTCQARFDVSTPQGDGTYGLFNASVNIFVSSRTGLIPAGWSFELYNPLYAGPVPPVSPGTVWNAEVDSLVNGTISGSAPYVWQALPADGSEINIGLVITIPVSNTSAFLPQFFSVDGQRCIVYNGQISRV